MHRAYSLVSVKDFDPVRRTFTGTASSPVPDRIGDVIKSEGITYQNPLPLLLYHNHTKPVGEVSFGKPSSKGTSFQALISTIDRESGVVKERLDEAVDSLSAKPPLVRGVSIGFRALEAPEFNKETGGFIFPKIEVVELSMVVIPAHQDATIDLVKSLDREQAAATGSPAPPVIPSGVTERPRVVSTRKDRPMKSVSENIKEFEGTRQAKTARMTELMSASDGETLDEKQAEEYDGLEAEIETVDKHLVRLRKHEEILKTTAVPVEAKSAATAAENRTGVIRVTTSLPPGLGFARSIMAKAVAFCDHRNAEDVAREMFPSDDRLHRFLSKAAVPAGTSTHATWMGPVVDQTNLDSEFIEFLRPRTILGQFGTNGIPPLNNVPFNVRITGQTSGAVAQWVGEGRSKPVTSFGTEAITLLYTKVAAIAVITEELARFSSPSAEMLVRNELVRANVERIDIDFIDPANAGTANVKPASITNGVTALTPSGTDGTAVINDIVDLLAQFLENNLDPSNLVLIMPSSLGMAVGMMQNALGQSQFPGVGAKGGTLQGIPVITSQYAANASGSGNLVIAVNADEIFLADDGQVRVDVSREAAIEMSDAPAGRSDVPTANTSVVSMFQTDSLALRSHRFINWRKRRTTAVSFIDDVNWGTVGSP